MGCGASKPKDGEAPMEPAPTKAKVIDDPPPTPAKEPEAPVASAPEPEPVEPEPIAAPEPEPAAVPEPVAAAPEPTPEAAPESIPAPGETEEEEEEEEEEHEPLIKWPENASIFIGNHQFGPTPAPPGPPKPGVPYKAILSGRASYGTGAVVDGDRPLGAIMPYCPYCARLSLLMLESGMDFVPILIDGGDKPEWFTDAFEAATTPAFLGQPGGVGDEWTGEFDVLLGNLKASGDANLLAMCEPGPVSLETISKHAGVVAFGSALSLIAGTELDAGKGLMKGLGGMAGGLFQEEGETVDAFRDRMVQAARDSLAEIEKIFSELAASGKPFFGGDKPNEADVSSITMFLFSHNIFAAGLTADPMAPCSLRRRRSPVAVALHRKVDGAPVLLEVLQDEEQVPHPAHEKLRREHVDDGARRAGRR